MTESASRRDFLRLSVGGALLLAAACRPAPNAAAPAAGGATSTAGSGSGSAGARLQLPTYMPLQGLTPDLPGTPEGIQDGFFSYPKNPFNSVPNPPGSGSDVSVFTNVSRAPLPFESNPVWQQVNKELGVNLKMIIAGTSADAAQKLGALIASDDLPDLMFLGPVSGASINNLPEFLAAKCADLTPFLSGDAVKDFPNLSHLPPYVWKAPGGIYDNKLYGVPVAQPVVGNALVTRQEMLDQAGVGPIKSASDFRKALEAVTRPNDDVYGLGDMQGFQLTPYLAAQTFGAPNNWRLDASGKLVKDWETEEFKAGLGYLRDLWAAKLIHPKSLTYTNTTAGADWAAGKIVFHYWTGGPLDWETGLKVNPKTKMTYTPPFSADGTTKPVFFLGTGNFGATIVKKGTQARVKELLGILNYSAAPFGSQERLLTYFGIEGADYTLDSDGNPVATANGYANNPLPFYYLSRGPAVAFNPTRSREYATMTHTAEEAEIPAGVQDATLGLYSPSNGSLGASLRQAIADGINDVVAGRVPLSNWDQVVRDWQDKGGNKIRQEYQSALNASRI